MAAEQRSFTRFEAARLEALEGERDDFVRVGTVTAIAASVGVTIGLILWFYDVPEVVVPTEGGGTPIGFEF